MKPLDVYSDEVGLMAVTREIKYINRSFFDESIPFESDGSLAAVAQTKDGKLMIINLVKAGFTV